MKAELASIADPELAAGHQRFFKTGPGEYGEGDVFLGTTVPERRRVARRNRELDLDGCRELLRSPVHEHRFVALCILRLRFESGERPERERIARLYLAERSYVNNWDLVDASAEYLLAERAASEPGRLDELAASPVLWDRRIAVLTTFAQIKQGDAREALRLCERLLDDDEDLIHKATGWMLREVGKRVDVELLRAFLADHAAVMPRTMLRYSIERLPAAERKRWMAARSEAAGETG